MKEVLQWHARPSDMASAPVEGFRKTSLLNLVCPSVSATSSRHLLDDSISTGGCHLPVCYKGAQIDFQPQVMEHG